MSTVGRNGCWLWIQRHSCVINMRKGKQQKTWRKFKSSFIFFQAENKKRRKKWEGEGGKEKETWR